MSGLGPVTPPAKAPYIPAGPGGTFTPVQAQFYGQRILQEYATEAAFVNLAAVQGWSVLPLDQPPTVIGVQSILLVGALALQSQALAFEQLAEIDILLLRNGGWLYIGNGQVIPIPGTGVGPPAPAPPVLVPPVNNPFPGGTANVPFGVPAPPGQVHPLYPSVGNNGLPTPNGWETGDPFSPPLPPGGQPPLGQPPPFVPQPPVLGQPPPGANPPPGLGAPPVAGPHTITYTVSVEFTLATQGSGLSPGTFFVSLGGDYPRNVSLADIPGNLLVVTTPVSYSSTVIGASATVIQVSQDSAQVIPVHAKGFIRVMKFAGGGNPVGIGGSGGASTGGSTGQNSGGGFGGGGSGGGGSGGGGSSGGGSGGGGIVPQPDQG